MIQRMLAGDDAGHAVGRIVRLAELRQADRVVPGAHAWGLVRQRMAREPGTAFHCGTILGKIAGYGSSCSSPPQPGGVL